MHVLAITGSDKIEEVHVLINIHQTFEDCRLANLQRLKFTFVYGLYYTHTVGNAIETNYIRR